MRIDFPMEEKVREIFTNLKMSVSVPPQAREFFHITVTPPQGGPILDVIRPTNQTPFYILGMGIGIHQYHQDSLRRMDTASRKEFVDSIKYYLLEMGVDVAFLPPNQDIPQLIHVSKLVFMDGLTPNVLLDVYYTVRNAGTYVIMRFVDEFGATLGRVADTKYI
ncbi:MAG: DUF2299 domain-containing protein [Metallosphaera yellowstonensis]|uniref:DUF2299 domain-containing protein n=1 Tax=Metallosphaera yellowstonensis MK1 TaxID=671065 RepID=H2C7B0_9CREN|nr:DUF2299 domain-containing protein [Metallosphaera yellowstonensis]EHP68036.1 hypothetical protein MetMK1DRAFT_00024590 [Metallosphaera yellowstonensis MK1]